MQCMLENTHTDSKGHTLKKFPSIEQFRHAVRAERDQAAHENRAPGKRLYRGTVKLHGTNAGVTLTPKDDLVFQSRNRILTLGDDNQGFVCGITPFESSLRDILTHIRFHHDLSDDAEVSIFGEWCGQGIQKGVAISSLPKMFVIFAAHANDQWIDPSVLLRTPGVPIYNICDFQTFHITIDFDLPGIAQNQMVAITESVEHECPVGYAFGVHGVGEGVVWTPISGDTQSKYWFKVKGEKHSSSRVATLAAVDVEVIKRKDDLVQSLVTPARLAQGLHWLVAEEKLELKIQNIGTFLRWVFNDIAKEEADTIEASGFQVKELGKPVSDVAKRYFMSALDGAVLAA
jgi:hypothetical protein